MKTTPIMPAESLEASASPRHPKGGVGSQMAGAGSIPDAGTQQTKGRKILDALTEQIDPVGLWIINILFWGNILHVF